MKDVMSPKHPRWDEFYEALAGADVCNFQEDKEGQVTWQCKGGRDKTFAHAILTKMGGFDVDASLKLFEENGGHCDCEILFNVIHRF